MHKHPNLKNIEIKSFKFTSFSHSQQKLNIVSSFIKNADNTRKNLNMNCLKKHKSLIAFFSLSRSLSSLSCCVKNKKINKFIAILLQQSCDDAPSSPNPPEIISTTMILDASLIKNVDEVNFHFKLQFTFNTSPESH